LHFEAGDEERPVEGPLTGNQYVITGTLESMSREQARIALEALGAKVSDNVSKKTTGVFVGESPGSKVAKAEKAGVPLLDEAALVELLQGGGEGRREPALRAPRGPRGQGRAVLEDREDVPVPDVARQARRTIRRAGLRTHHAPRRGSLHPVLECAADPRDRERAHEGRPQVRVAPREPEQRGHRSGGQSVGSGQARAVDDPNARERHAGGAEHAR